MNSLGFKNTLESAQTLRRRTRPEDYWECTIFVSQKFLQGANLAFGYYKRYERCCLRDCGIVSQLNCDLNCVLTDIFQICCRQAKSENICAWIEAEDIFVIGKGSHSDLVFPYSTVIDSIKVSFDFANWILDGWERLCAWRSEHRVSHISHTEGIKRVHAQSPIFIFQISSLASWTPKSFPRLFTEIVQGMIHSSEPAKLPGVQTWLTLVTCEQV